MRRWLLGSAVLAGCLPEAPTELEGKLGFSVQDAILIPCKTVGGEQMLFGLARSGSGCQGHAPRKRTCEGLTSLLAYPFACQTGAIPMTLTTSDATLVWIGGVTELQNLSTATVTAVEHRACRGTPQTLGREVVISDPGSQTATLDFQFEEMTGAVPFTVCR